VVVDDASTDGTAEIARRYAEVRLIRLPKNVGHENARNRGMLEAEAPWIAMCDSDDCWLSTKLERQIAFINAWQGDRPIVVLGTAGINVSESGLPQSSLPCTMNDEFEFLRRRDEGIPLLLPHTSVLISREIALKVGGYRTDWSGAEDVELWDRMAQFGVVLGLRDELVLYRKRRQSHTQRNFWAQQINYFRLVENLQRRSQHQPELTYSDTLRLIASKRRREQLTLKISWTGQYLYRTGAAWMVNGRRIAGSVCLAGALVLDRRRVVAGVMKKLERR
jgi:glycosyltransferase involved in cell wall biosynthesis